MPESLQKQMVSIQFSDAVGEGSLEWNVKLASLPHEDRQRLELIDNTISKYETNNYYYCVARKFGGLAVYITTAKLKSAKISYSHIQCT